MYGIFNNVDIFRSPACMRMIKKQFVTELYFRYSLSAIEEPESSRRGSNLQHADI